jgi:cytochrome c peroxidase
MTRARCTAAASLAAAMLLLLSGGAVRADATLGLPPLGPASAAPPALAALGRALFFERRLAVNGTLSCAMCHLPEQGFTAHELRTSVGMEGVSLRRNAPTLLNVAFVPALFHDGRAPTLERQALQPLVHPDEMANPNLPSVVRRLAGWPEYRPLFARAFGDARPSATRIARALAAYERTLLAGDSRFDRWRYGGQADALTAQQRQGFALFQSLGCVACHPVGERHALFTDQAFRNVGTQARSEAARRRDVRVELIPGQTTTMSPAELARVGVADAPDRGRQEVTQRAEDARAYRTPSLRNVALTPPYMHDGSLATLDEVLDHYAAGGWPDDPLQDPRIRPFTLDRAGRDALIAFLHSLTASRLPDATRPDLAAMARQAAGRRPRGRSRTDRTLACRQLAVQPGARQRPVALDGGQRNAQRLGDLVVLQPAEKAQLHHLGRARVDGLERQQRLVHRHQVAVRRRAQLLHARQRHRHQLGVTLVGAAGQFVVDQDAPHHGRGHGQEMAAVLPLRACLLAHAEPGLVGERRGRQRVAQVLAPQLAARGALDLVVQQLEQALPHLGRRRVQLRQPGGHIRWQRSVGRAGGHGAHRGGSGSRPAS